MIKQKTYLLERGRTLKPDLDSSRPIYKQIAEIIKEEILKGNIEEEERVMSTNELSEFYQINPATAGKGLNLLVDEGVLYKKRGVGMFVAKGARDKIIRERRQNFFNHYIEDLLREADKLNIDREELITMIKNYDPD